MKDVIKDFLLELEMRDASKDTVRGYKNSLKQFNVYLGDVEVEQIKSLDMKSYIKFSKDRGLKTKTINSYISSIRALYNYLIDEEVVNKNIALSVKLTNTKDKKEIEVFTPEEVKQLISYKKIAKSI